MIFAWFDCACGKSVSKIKHNNSNNTETHSFCNERAALVGDGLFLGQYFCLVLVINAFKAMKTQAFAC